MRSEIDKYAEVYGRTYFLSISGFHFRNSSQKSVQNLLLGGPELGRGRTRADQGGSVGTKGGGRIEEYNQK